MTVLSLCALALCAAALAVFLKPIRPEAAMAVSIAACAVVFFYALGYLADSVRRINDFAREIGVDGGYVAIVLKIIAVSYIASLTGALCSDAGESALATVTQTAAKIMITALTLPLFEEVYRAIGEFLAST